MITEDEAKTKWCPFARSIVSTGGGANRGKDSGGSPPPHVNCIGSACMAWRRVPKARRDQFVEDLVHATGSSDKGYCGLAGPTDSIDVVA